MDEAKFKEVYSETRNGANGFFRHPLVRQFQYSDGVKDLAETGCYWLLDIIATECLMPLRNSGEVMGMIEVNVDDNKADLFLTIDDNKPSLWSRHIDLTDMPKGRWVFELDDEGDRFALILLTEH